VSGRIQINEEPMRRELADIQRSEAAKQLRLGPGAP
jgi:hypothetical protein